MIRIYAPLTLVVLAIVLTALLAWALSTAGDSALWR